MLIRNSVNGNRVMFKNAKNIQELLIKVEKVQDTLNIIKSHIINRHVKNSGYNIGDAVVYSYHHPFAGALPEKVSVIIRVDMSRTGFIYILEDENIVDENCIVRKLK